MSEGHLEVIHLDDEENENSDEEDTEEEEDGDTDDPSPENAQEEVVVLGESDATSSSSESGDDEESASSGDEAVLLSDQDQDEIQILSDDDANDISNNAEEPVIVLGSAPINLETCSKESAKPSTSLGSQLPPNSCSDVNYEDFDCFVDPEDESQTSTKRTEETQPSLQVCSSNNHPSPCNELFLDYEEFRDTALEDELAQLSSSEDEDSPVGDDLSRSLAHASNPQVANEDIISDIGMYVEFKEQRKFSNFFYAYFFWLLILGFKIFERDIFVEVSTLKSMIPNLEMNDLLKSMENKGWKISDCVKFCGWEMQYIGLELAKHIIPKQCLLGKLIHQLNVSNKTNFVVNI